jgi:hypothetical protein
MTIMTGITTKNMTEAIGLRMMGIVHRRMATGLRAGGIIRPMGTARPTGIVRPAGDNEACKLPVGTNSRARASRRPT